MPADLATIRGQLALGCATYDDACALIREVDRLTAERDRLRDERDELCLTLDNERGEGAPPSEGWKWGGACWVRDLPDNRQLRVSLEADIDTPNWRCWEEAAEDYSGSFIVNAPTARAAMITADRIEAAALAAKESA